MVRCGGGSCGGKSSLPLLTKWGQMVSYYDPVKTCRVSRMDEAQFHSEAEGTLKWGAGGVSLRGEVDDKDVSVCFLAPQFAGKQDRIELAFTTLLKQIGPARASELEASLRSAAGEKVLGKTMISIVTPGKLPPAHPSDLTRALLDLLSASGSRTVRSCIAS